MYINSIDFSTCEEIPRNQVTLHMYTESSAGPNFVREMGLSSELADVTHRHPRKGSKMRE